MEYFRLFAAGGACGFLLGGAIHLLFWIKAQLIKALNSAGK